jgi:antitoxin HigA-1
MTTRDPARPPIHPGAILREDVLPALDLTVAGAARTLGVSRRMLRRVMYERAAITPEMAVRVGKMCGNGARLWVDLQRTYDLWHAERNLAGQLKEIPTLHSVA